mgnify:CR=1 FL=1
MESHEIHAKLRKLEEVIHATASGRSMFFTHVEAAILMGDIDDKPVVEGFHLNFRTPPSAIY